MRNKNQSLFPDLEPKSNRISQYPSPKNGKEINDWLFQNIPNMSEGRYVYLWRKLNDLANHEPNRVIELWERLKALILAHGKMNYHYVIYLLECEL